MALKSVWAIFIAASLCLTVRLMLDRCLSWISELPIQFIEIISVLCRGFLCLNTTVQNISLYVICFLFLLTKLTFPQNAISSGPFTTLGGMYHKQVFIYKCYKEKWTNIPVLLRKLILMAPWMYACGVDFSFIFSRSLVFLFLCAYLTSIRRWNYFLLFTSSAKYLSIKETCEWVVASDH